MVWTAGPCETLALDIALLPSRNGDINGRKTVLYSHQNRSYQVLGAADSFNRSVTLFCWVGDKGSVIFAIFHNIRGMIFSP